MKYDLIFAIVTNINGHNISKLIKKSPDFMTHKQSDGGKSNNTFGWNNL